MQCENIKSISKLRSSNVLTGKIRQVKYVALVFRPFQGVEAVMRVILSSPESLL